MVQYLDIIFSHLRFPPDQESNMSNGYYFIHPNGTKIGEPLEQDNSLFGIMDGKGSNPGKHYFVRVKDGTPYEFGPHMASDYESYLRIKTVTAQISRDVVTPDDDKPSIMQLADNGIVFYRPFYFIFSGKQEWKVKIDGNKASFECVWLKGQYLGVKDGKLSSEEEEVWWTIEEA